MTPKAALTSSALSIFILGCAGIFASDPGGTRYRLTTAEPQHLEATAEILRERMRDAGTRHGTVSIEGEKLDVYVPSTIVDTKLLFMVGDLTFHQVDEPWTRWSEASPEAEEALEGFLNSAATIPTPMQDFVAPSAPELSRSARFATWQRLHTPAPTGAHAQRAPVVIGPVLLTGSIDKAALAVDGLDQPYISVEFNAEGAIRFGEITAEHTEARLAIAIDGMVFSAPVIQEPITRGQVNITMSSTDSAATATMAAVLNTTPLPASVTVEEMASEP